jgi:superfamily II DNA or RNA helicase
MPEGTPLNPKLTFKGSPFDYQEAIIKTFTDAGCNGLICVPCGKGKTFMALAIAYRIGKKFLVVVDKEFLLNQWKGEMEAFFPGLKIGIIQEEKKQLGIVENIIKEPSIEELKDKIREFNKDKTKDKKLKLTGTKDELLVRVRSFEPEKEPEPPQEYDCAIAMIQTLVRRNFGSEDFKGFGFTIFDECHHLGASNFSQALLKVQTKYMLGLSATPTRDDGLTKVFEWYLGKPVYWEKRREADTTVSVKGLQFHKEDARYSEVPVDYRGDPVLARLLTKVIECEERNDWIVQQILDLLKEDGRRILVLGERIKQLEVIEAKLLGLKPSLNIGYYIGGMKEEKRETAGREANVLLASYAMASEAMNIKTLNTVLLASPRKKVEQSVGRILRERPHERKVPPLIVDVIDSHGLYQGQWRKRRAFYKACGYKILLQKYNSEETSEDSASDDEPAQQGACGFVSEDD